MKLISGPNTENLTLIDYLKKQNSLLLNELDTACGGKGICGRCRVLVNAKVERACKYIPSEGDEIITMAGEKPEIESSVRFDFKGGKEDGYACAVDLGTTTVVCALVNLKTGIIECSESQQNCQKVYGSDVISRMSFACNNDHDRLEISSVIRNQIKDLCLRVMQKKGILSLRRVVIASNTAMAKILLAEDCSSLIKAPFQGCCDGFSGVVDGKQVVVLGGNFAYFGSDLSAGLYAGGFYQANRPALFVDAGTNGEVALACDNGVLFSSSAAGPAFESAIESGLYGSEIVNVLARCLNDGLIDETGRIEGKNAPFSQREVRNIQLAKGAVAATISCLMKRAGIGEKDLKTVFLAGGFGSALSIENAIRIGLLPNAENAEFRVLGNASLGGACMVACTPEKAFEVCDTVRKGEYVELFNDTSFNEEYMEKMMFEQEM